MFILYLTAFYLNLFLENEHKIDNKELYEKCVELLNVNYLTKEDREIFDKCLKLPSSNRTYCRGDMEFSETNLEVEREIDERGGILCVGKVKVEIGIDLFERKKIKVKLKRIPKYREDIFSLRDIYRIEPKGYQLDEGLGVWYGVEYYFDNNILELNGVNITEEYLRGIYQKLRSVEIEEWPDVRLSGEDCSDRKQGEKNDLFLINIVNKEAGVLDNRYVERLIKDMKKEDILINPGRCYEDRDGNIYRVECMNCSGHSSIEPSEDAIGDRKWCGCKGYIYSDSVSLYAIKFGDIIVPYEIFEGKPLRFKRMIDCTWLKPINKKDKGKKQSK